MKDKQVNRLIVREQRRQEGAVNLVASENYVSDDVREALGSVFTNKYAEGYPHARYYGGNKIVDELEELCKARALDLFDLSSRKWHVNVQPLSGSPANLAAYLALVPPGEKIMGMELSCGGHLTHGQAVSVTGSLWEQVPYCVGKETETLDYAALAEIAQKEKPKLIVTGYTAYPREIDFKKFRKIADSVGAYLLVDMSHIAGLVAGGMYQSPFSARGGQALADVVTTTTHKTLRGPRGAMIFCKKELAAAVDKAVFPRLQGGPHLNAIAATAVALREANTAQFRRYAKRVVANARVLAAELARCGWRIVSGGTDTHLLLVDTWAGGAGISGKEASERLEGENIIVNKNTIPFDVRSPRDPSGIRLGTAAETTRGAGGKDMKEIAGRINAALKTVHYVR